jgi:hypothetical protein
VTAYELDDALVRRALNLEGGRIEATELLLMEIGRQMPIPVPTKIGAVVRTAEYGTLTLTSSVRLEEATWVAPNGQRFHAAEIGRITEVLAPGVDL